MNVNGPTEGAAASCKHAKDETANGQSAGELSSLEGVRKPDLNASNIAKGGAQNIENAANESARKAREMDKQPKSKALNAAVGASNAIAENAVKDGGAVLQTGEAVRVDDAKVVKSDPENAASDGSHPTEKDKVNHVVAASADDGGKLREGGGSKAIEDSAGKDIKKGDRSALDRGDFDVKETATNERDEEKKLSVTNSMELKDEKGARVGLADDGADKMDVNTRGGEVAEREGTRGEEPLRIHGDGDTQEHPNGPEHEVRPPEVSRQEPGISAEDVSIPQTENENSDVVEHKLADAQESGAKSEDDGEEMEGKPQPEQGSKKRTKDYENQSTPKKPRRSSARNSVPPRTLRPRPASRASTEGGLSESAVVHGAALPTMTPEAAPDKTKASPPPSENKTGSVEDDGAPRPVVEARGLCMRIDDAVFVTEDQLDELKIARLMDKNVKPFEHLTFQDLRTYNRDQLRAYCFAYGMARRKKTEMEADMARYVSYWNRGRPGFALHEYVPTSSRVIDKVEPNPADLRGHVTSASREGSATPSVSEGRGIGTSGRQNASRGATPARADGTTSTPTRAASSARTAALGTAGAAVVTGSSQTPQTTPAGATARNASGANKAQKSGAPTPILPRGFSTSFKQRVHAKQAGAKFKAAYNGAGPAIVNIVENAAAYFEGKDSGEVILDQAKSYERYQFNVDMLTEIFDGAPQSEEEEGDTEMTSAEPNGTTSGSNMQTEMKTIAKGVLQDLAKRMVTGKRTAQMTELDVLEKQFKDMEEQTKHTERTNMRLFQRLERAETKEQVESVKEEFEAEHDINFENECPPPLVRRKLDKSLPPLLMADDKCRILRFKVS